MTKTYCLLITVLIGFTSWGHLQAAKIRLYGLSKDNSIDEVSLGSYSPFFWHANSVVELAKAGKSPNNGFYLEVAITKPQKARISIHGKSWPIFITPGDSIHFVITRINNEFKISFSGVNSAHYTYYDTVIPREDIDDPVFSNDIGNYKTDVAKHYQRKIDFFRVFASLNKVSEYFKWFVLTECAYQRYVLLFRPIGYDQFKLANIPETYLDDVTLLEWNSDSLLNIRSFNVAIVLKNIYYYTDDLSKNFKKTLNNVNNSFTGKTREHLIVSLIDIYASKQLPDYRDSLVSLMESVDKNLSDSLYIRQVAKSKEVYLMLDRPFPKNVAETTYLKDYKTDKTISFSELLTNHKGKSIYIDFWASWCSACRIDIADSGPSKEYLKDNDVTIIYISIDKSKDEAKWRKATIDDKVTENQYMLQESLKSPLAKYLTLDYIPRYALLNPQHLIKSTNAPRLNQAYLENLKLEVSKMKQKVITFK